MAGVDRIVKRNGLKEKLAQLENVVRSSKVIGAAQNMLANVFREGFSKGYQAHIDELAKNAERAEVDAIIATGPNNTVEDVVNTGLAQVSEGLVDEGDKNEEPAVAPANT